MTTPGESTSCCICGSEAEGSFSGPSPTAIRINSLYYIHYLPGLVISLFIAWRAYNLCTSSTAQGGGGSFKNRKPIGNIGCCESGMAERIHWWTGKVLEVSSLSLSFSDYLLTYQPIFYVSIYLSIYLSLSFLFHLITYLPIYLSTYLPIYQSTNLPIYLSTYLSLSLSLSSVYLSSCLPVCLSICLSVYLSICGAVSFSVM